MSTDISTNYSDVGAFAWSLDRRYEYALARMEKTMDLYPKIAEVWLKEANRLADLIKQRDLVDSPA